MAALLTLVLACAALAGDVLSTVKVIRGGGHEVNPVMRWLMGLIGLWPALVVTHAGFAVVLGLAGFWWLNLLAVAAFGWVTFHNLGQVRKV